MSPVCECQDTKKVFSCEILVINVPFLKMCIRSLDSSTLPSASMTPGRVSRAADWAGELTAATFLCRRTADCWLSGVLLSSAAGFSLESIRACRTRNPGVHRWRRARSSTEPQQTNCQPPILDPKQHASPSESTRKGFLSKQRRILKDPWGSPNLLSEFQKNISSFVDSHSAARESYDCTLRSRSGPHSRWRPDSKCTLDFCANVSPHLVVLFTNTNHQLSSFSLTSNPNCHVAVSCCLSVFGVMQFRSWNWRNHRIGGTCYIKHSLVIENLIAFMMAPHSPNYTCESRGTRCPLDNSELGMWTLEKRNLQ